MLKRNCLGITSLFSLGLIAACSSDSSTTPKDELGNIPDGESGIVTNVCLYDGYSAMQGANDETLCLNAEGVLAFWINADGTYGFPEATEDGNSTGTDIPGSSAASNGNSTEPNTPSNGEATANSSSSVTGCSSDKAVYTINGISYYLNDDGSLY